jgi:hypothetical protein
MRIQLELQLGPTWDLYANAEEQTLLLELLRTNFEDTGILNYKIEK